MAVARKARSERGARIARAWSAGRAVAELGEFALLARIRRWLGEGPQAVAAPAKGRSGRAARQIGRAHV